MCKTDSKKQPEKEILIQWKGLPKEKAPWQSTSSIQQHFPNFNLKDKVILEKECILKLPIRFTYAKLNKKNWEATKKEYNSKQLEGTWEGKFVRKRDYK